MLFQFNGDSGWNELLVVVATVSIGYLFHHWLTLENPPQKWLFKKHEPCPASLRSALFTRLSGVFFFGLIPMAVSLFLLEDHNIPGTGPVHFTRTLIWYLPCGALLILTIAFSPRSHSDIKQDQLIDCPEWNWPLLILSASGWTAYLLAYEFMFRGFFLFTAVENIGIWPAIVLNTCIYALVHLPRSSKLALGSIPLGIILCLGTLDTGTIWFAGLTHLTLALSNEWFTLKHHPRFKFIPSWS